MSLINLCKISCLTLFIYPTLLLGSNKNIDRVCSTPTTVAGHGYIGVKVCLPKTTPIAKNINKRLSLMEFWEEDNLVLLTGGIDLSEQNNKPLSELLNELLIDDPRSIINVLYSEFEDRFKDIKSVSSYFDAENNQLFLLGESNNNGRFIEAVVSFNGFDESAYLIQLSYDGEKTKSRVQLPDRVN